MIFPTIEPDFIFPVDKNTNSKKRPRLRERKGAKWKVQNGELWNGGNISHGDTKARRENRSQCLYAVAAAYKH